MKVSRGGTLQSVYWLNLTYWTVNSIKDEFSLLTSNMSELWVFMMCTPDFQKTSACIPSLLIHNTFLKKANYLKSFNAFTSHFNHPFQPLDFVSTKSQILPYEH